MIHNTVWEWRKTVVIVLLLALGMPVVCDAQIQNLQYHVDNDKNNIVVSWSTVADAHEYQLEWYFENMYNDKFKGVGAKPGKLSFADGATRVSVKNTKDLSTSTISYKIPNIYEKGILYYRVRSVKYDDPKKNRHPQYSEWTTEAKGIELEAHMGDNMNWQYTTAFAEGGKSKDVVSYYDGTMRSRQSVTRNSTNNDVLVGEVFYDERGRASIQTLPVPADEINAEKPEFKFRKDFSKKENGKEPYSLEDYSRKDGCNLSAAKMGTSSGASHYYSESNQSTDGYNAFIPDAEGYPFSQVQYLNDNTGRVSRQGGVGEAYQIGRHDTKFYYATPAVEDLVRMFGREVGTDCHNYRKNMVVGPDSLTSNTYLDKYGRKIATSLTGKNKLPGQDDLTDKEEETRTITILDFPQLDENQKVVFSEYYYLVPNEGASAQINYNFKGIRFASEDDICFDCAYSIEIDMRDDCGNTPGVGNITVNGKNDENIGTFPITIPFNDKNAVSGKQLQLTIPVTSMSQGRYKITRRLVVDEQLLKEKVEAYLATTTKVKKLVDFVREGEASVDFSVCKPKNCEDECLAQAKTYEEYLSCLVACENPDEEDDSMDRCKTAKKLMISDFMPGQLNSIERGADNKIERIEVLGGQYASYKVDAETGKYQFNDEVGNDGKPISIFSSKIFKEAFIISSDIQDESDKIKYVLDGFEKARAEDKAEEWAEKYAKKYHPEWQLQDDCSFNKESELFDTKLKLIGSFAEAIKAGVYPNILDKDPYFKNNQTKKDQMDSYLNKKYTEANVDYSAKQLAAIMTGYFKDNDSKSAINAFLSDIDGLKDRSRANAYNCQNGASIYYDSYWEAFRTLYLSKKMSMNNTVRTESKFREDLSTEGKQLRFATYSEDEKQLMDLTDPDEANAYKDNVTDAEIWDACRKQAEAQVISCMEDLKECVRLNNTAFVWSENSDNDENISSSPIAKAFVKIMTASCKQSMVEASSEIGKYFNMFGNTSLTKGALDAYNSHYEDKLNEKYISFRAVMDDMIGAENYSYDCNPDLVSEPRETGNKLFEQAIKPLDGCGCDRILEIEAEFNKNFSQLPLNLSVSSEVYMENKYGLSVNDYQQVVCACKSVLKDHMHEYNGWRAGLEWTNAANDKLKETGLIIPADLACEKCVTCDDIKDFVNNWNPTWCRDVDLQINSGRDLMRVDLMDKCRVQTADRIFEWDSLSVQKVVKMREALTNALNNHFQSDHLFVSYQDLYNACMASEGKPDADVEKCEVSEMGGNLAGLLEQLLLKHYLTGDRTIITTESTQESESGEKQHQVTDLLNEVNDKYGADGVYGDEDGKVCDETLKPYFDKLKYSDCKSPVYTVTNNSDKRDPNAPIQRELIVSDSSSVKNSCMVDVKSGEWVKPRSGDAGVLTFTLSNLGDCPIYIRFVGHASDTKDYKFRNVLSIHNPRLSECSSSDNNVILADAELAVGGEVITAAVEIYADAQCLPLVVCKTLSNAGQPTLCKEEQERLTPLSCEEELRKVVYRNAEGQYEEYISEVRRTLMGEYARTCMRTKDSEEMKMTFKDREYQFTLFYYDLAGNLVRTVPPAGVELLSDAEVEKVIEDRRLGKEPDVYTKHRMQTLYHYNSLNQLVEQYMPDHDAFSTVTKSGNGLPNNIKVVSTAYTDAMNGVLTAIDPSNSNNSNVYTTHDGGQNWVLSNNLKKNHYNDISVNRNVMYLVGDGGAMLRSDNRGETWVVESAATTEDIIFIRTYGDNQGYFITSNGNVYLLSSNTWTKHANIGLDKVYEVVYDKGSSKLYAVGQKNGISTIAYTKTQMEWKTDVEMSLTGAPTIAMQGENGYALSEDGVMLSTSDGGDTWSYRNNENNYKSIKCYNGSYMATTDEADKIYYGTDINGLTSASASVGRLYSVSGGKLYSVSANSPTIMKSGLLLYPLSGIDVEVKSFIYDSPTTKAVFLTEKQVYCAKQNSNSLKAELKKTYDQLLDYTVNEGMFYVLGVNNGQKELYCYNLKTDEFDTKPVANDIVSFAVVDSKFIMGDGNGRLYTCDESKLSTSKQKSKITASGFITVDSDKDYTVAAGLSSVVLVRESADSEWKLQRLKDKTVKINAVAVDGTDKDIYVGDSNGQLSHFVNGKWLYGIEIGNDVSITSIDRDEEALYIGAEDGSIYVWTGANNQAKLGSKIRRIRTLGNAGVWAVGEDGLLKKMIK